MTALEDGSLAGPDGDALETTIVKFLLVALRDGEEMQDGSTIIQKDDASVLNGMLDRWEKLYPDWDIDWPERTQGAKP